MAVQQNKSVGMVANTMTITKLVNESKNAGVPLKMIEEPMVLQPIGVGMKKDEPALLAKVNETLLALDKGGEINQIWDKWLGAEHRVQDGAHRQGRAARRTEIHAYSVISLACETSHKSCGRAAIAVGGRQRPDSERVRSQAYTAHTGQDSRRGRHDQRQDGPA